MAFGSRGQFKSVGGISKKICASKKIPGKAQFLMTNAIIFQTNCHLRKRISTKRKRPFFSIGKGNFF